MSNPKIGLLPMYLELYDRSMPELRAKIDAFRETIAEELGKRELDVVAAPVCRVKDEFSGAIRAFEAEKVDAVVTVHLAYSPSLESSEVLAATKLPIIILDTTPAYDFGPEQEAEEILYNHGIHGVQDMCNLLIRNKKQFFIEAGHWKESDVLDRIAGCARAVKAANSIRNAKVGRIGEPFKGMGDFDVARDVLRDTIGVETVLYDFSAGAELIRLVKEEEIEEEIALDRKTYGMDKVQEEVHRKSSRVNIAVRKWIESEKLTAFTANFMATQDQPGFPVMTFLEAGKAMARGIGYAGEGDVLTAALVGALLSVYPETTFTEMFCPDWKGNSIFLSHMGEYNIKLSAERPVLAEKDFPYTNADNPVVAYGRLKGGEAVLVNLAPSSDNSYTLIVSGVEALDIQSEDRMKESVHGWIRPSIPVADFLMQYSTAGGTHHVALVYGNVAGEICKFGEIMGWKVVRI